MIWLVVLIIIVLVVGVGIIISICSEAVVYLKEYVFEVIYGLPI